MSLTWPAKDPAEVLDYKVDWTSQLDGDTIATSVFSLTTGAGLNIDSKTNDPTSATVWLSGGTPGLVATLRNIVTTAGGRTLDETIILEVLDGLIVETGAGLASADSYIALVGADLYHARRGNAGWSAASAGTRQAALRRATDYMVQVFRNRWAGTRMTSTQALDWPRYGVPMMDAPGSRGGAWNSYGGPSYYDYQSVPPAVAQACADLALKALAGDLTPDLTQAVKSKKVGPVEVVYQDYSSASKSYRAIDNLLSPLLASGGAIRVQRA